jgi:hypothetical protein
MKQITKKIALAILGVVAITALAGAQTPAAKPDERPSPMPIPICSGARS